MARLRSENQTHPKRIACHSKDQIWHVFILSFSEYWTNNLFRKQYLPGSDMLCFFPGFRKTWHVSLLHDANAPVSDSKYPLPAGFTRHAMFPIPSPNGAPSQTQGIALCAEVSAQTKKALKERHPVTSKHGMLNFAHPTLKSTSERISPRWGWSGHAIFRFGSQFKHGISPVHSPLIHLTKILQANSSLGQSNMPCFHH